jgi:hypothetical protein
LIHSQALLDRLEGLSRIEFSGEVFRATRLGLDPLAASTRGGRWSPRDALDGTDSVATLYTSCVREGSLAELAFHYSQWTPFPSKPVLVHQLRLTTQRTLRLVKGDLMSLGIEWSRYRTLNYEKTQQIGAAVAFLGCDGLIAPSARWDCENLMLFATHHSLQCELTVIGAESVLLKEWAAHNGFLG